MNIKSPIPLWLKLTLLTLAPLLLLADCFWVKARYDPQGLQYAVTIQKEALELLGKADEPYYHHKEQVYRLLSLVESAYDHVRVRTKNQPVTDAWEVQRSPYANRLSHFMEEWKIEGILTEKKITTYKKWLNDDFKLLIQLEEKKKK